MAANPYIVVMTATHPRDGSTLEHRVSLEAYSAQEAVMQAFIELDAKHAYAEQQFKLKVISVGPDTEKAALRLTSLLADIGLLRMPTQGQG